MDNKLFVLSAQNSIANQFIAEMRDVSAQKDRMRFRRNLERLGEILAYEISRSLGYERRSVQTPLGESSVSVLRAYPVLVSIMRAGVPFHQGFLNVFDQADSGFVGAYRNEHSASVTVNVDYASIPSIDQRVVLLIDPMLATGRSVVDAQKVLLRKGTPSHWHLVSVVAAPEGLGFLKENFQGSYSLWTCAVDEKLNSSFYIVPGLGDAGDLSYGVKL